jgi:hypothetical protein
MAIDRDPLPLTSRRLRNISAMTSLPMDSFSGLAADTLYAAFARHATCCMLLAGCAFKGIAWLIRRRLVRTCRELAGFANLDTISVAAFNNLTANNVYACSMAV